MEITFDMSTLPHISYSEAEGGRCKLFSLSEGKPLVVNNAPSGVDQTPIHDAIGVLAKYENSRQSILVDNRLSDLGRREALAQLLETQGPITREAVEIIERRVQQTESHLVAATREAYGPQPLLESNAVGAMNDQLVARHCLDLKGPELTRTLEAMQRGEKLYFAQALTRIQALGFDLPAAWTAVLPDVWSKHCSSIRPGQVAKASLLSAQAEWQRQSITTIMSKLPPKKAGVTVTQAR
ncbi:MAG: hypothetical protein HY016_08835 [Nitrosomonadales bacterium]|nr:hypothetical protein [Nitrosomonadales bacterium]